MARTYFEIYILCLLTLCFSFVACGTSSEAVKVHIHMRQYGKRDRGVN
jgi:hypothetical protein